MLIQAGSLKASKSTTSWKKLVDSLDVSSGNHCKENLIDGEDLTYWKSAGPPGKHKITLTMRPGAIVTSLVMQVSLILFRVH